MQQYLVPFLLSKACERAEMPTIGRHGDGWRGILRGIAGVNGRRKIHENVALDDPTGAQTGDCAPDARGG